MRIASLLYGVYQIPGTGYPGTLCTVLYRTRNTRILPKSAKTPRWNRTWLHRPAPFPGLRDLRDLRGRTPFRALSASSRSPSFSSSLSSPLRPTRWRQPPRLNAKMLASRTAWPAPKPAEPELICQNQRSCRGPLMVILRASAPSPTLSSTLYATTLIIRHHRMWRMM